jgi:hypothetical protein
MAGLQRDAPPHGRKPTIGARLRKRAVTLTTSQQPANATHWSTRTMAADSRHQRGQRAAYLARAWAEAASRGNYKVIDDPECAERVEDIVGLYLDPPEYALALCADEKEPKFKLWIVLSPACL